MSKYPMQDGMIVGSEEWRSSAEEVDREISTEFNQRHGYDPKEKLVDDGLPEDTPPGRSLERLMSTDLAALFNWKVRQNEPFDETFEYGLDPSGTTIATTYPQMDIRWQPYRGSKLLIRLDTTNYISAVPLLPGRWNIFIPSTVTTTWQRHRYHYDLFALVDGVTTPLLYGEFIVESAVTVVTP